MKLLIESLREQLLANARNRDQDHVPEMPARLQPAQQQQPTERA